MSAIGYRPELDGLRAVAVLAVILFHLGVPWCTGGYLGVDVFFVLSGFLITSIMLREEEEGAFSLARFWIRRIRRILPALLVMLLVTSLVSGAVCFKPTTIYYGEQGAAAALSFANIVLWQQVSDYWGEAAQRTPFLHTWSLSVEEQFYLVYPILVWSVLRWGRTYLAATMASVCVASCLLSLPGSGWTDSAIFYLLPARAWELALGGFLAAFCPGRTPSWLARLMPVGTLLGLALVVGVCFVFGEKKNTAAYLAVPAIGTGLVLACSSGHPDLTVKCLSIPPLVTLGRLSYSLYLWHWPVIVLGEQLGLHSSSPFDCGIMMAVMLLLAFASHHLVEMPARYHLSTRGSLWLIGILLAMSLGASAFLHFRPKSYDTSMYSTPVFRGKSYDVNPNLDGNSIQQKADGNSRHSYQWQKTFATGGIVRRYGDSAPTIMVLGDSHATMWSAVIDTVAKDLGAGICFYATPGTDPFLSDPPESTRRKSPKMSREDLLAYDRGRLDALDHWKPKVVILGARWDKFTFKHVEDLIIACGRAGSTVLLLEQPPRPQFGDYEAVQYLSFIGMRPEKGRLQSLPDADTKSYRRGRDVLRQLVDRYDFCRIVPVAELFRAPERGVWVLDGKNVLYWDDDHLAQAGADRARDLIRDAIQAAF